MNQMLRVAVVQRLSAAAMILSTYERNLVSIMLACCHAPDANDKRVLSELGVPDHRAPMAAKTRALPTPRLRSCYFALLILLTLRA